MLSRHIHARSANGWRIAALACTLLLARAAQGDIQYTFKALGPVTGTDSSASAINNAGQVVGWIGSNSGTDHAFLYSNGVLTDLGTLGGSVSVATGINDAGEVVGRSTAAPGPDGTPLYAFSYKGGVFTNLNVVSQASGTGDPHDVSVDNSGQIALRLNNHAMLYTNGSLVDLGTWGPLRPFESAAAAINSKGQIVGFADGNTLNHGLVRHAFIYSNGHNSDLGSLGGNLSFATAINDAGQVAGYSNFQDNDAFYHAFLDTNGSVSDLGTLEGPNSESFSEAINASGTVVGYSFLPGVATAAFVYSGGRMIDLNSVTALPAGWSLREATGVNDNGQIVGWAITPAGNYDAYLLTPIPEPAAWASLLAFGMILLPRARPARE